MKYFGNISKGQNSYVFLRKLQLVNVLRVG